MLRFESGDQGSYGVCWNREGHPIVMVMSEAEAIRIGDWTAVRSTGQLKRGEQTVHLEPRVMNVLFALAERPGQAVSLQELMDAVWGDMVVAPESVYQAIAVLRKALAKDSDKTEYIVTVPKRGYLLAVPAAAVPLGDEQEPLDHKNHPAEAMASAMGRTGMRIAAALLLVITVLLAKVLTSDPGANAVPKRIVVVASDRAAGGLADGLVKQFLESDRIRLLTPSVPMYAGPGMEEQILMARALDADFVINLSDEGSDHIELSILQLASEEMPKRRQLSIDYSHPAMAVEDAADTVETLLRRLPVSSDDNRVSRRSISEAAQLEALGRYFMQRRFTRGENPRAALHQARVAFRQAIEADRDFVPAWTGLGISQLLASQYAPEEEVPVHITTGRAAIDRALAIAPDSAEAYAALGLAAEFEGDYLAARAALERAVSLDPSDPVLMRWLSRLMSRLGYYRKAAILATGAAENAPFSPEILHSASLYSYFAGDLDASITFAKAALDLEPRMLTEIANLFVAYREQGQLDKAIATGRSLLDFLQSQNDESGHFRWAKGMVSDLYIDLGLLETARALAVQAREDAPAVHETERALARLALAEGDIRSAHRQMANWAEISDSTVKAADVAVNATVAGMDALGLRLMESIPGADILPDGMNPMLETGRWLKTDYLYFASLPAVYRALLYLRNGEMEEARRLLGKSERFLGYWSDQGLSRKDCLYLRAAVFAMQDKPDAGLRALLAAIESGWRDGWRIRHDPALDRLREHPEFANVLSRLDEILAIQRKNVITSEMQIALPLESRVVERQKPDK